MNKSSSAPESPSFPPIVVYVTTVVLSWLLPGAGHWVLGYRVRALVLGVAILGTFWIGETVLGENLAVTRQVHPVFFGLQAGSGASAFIADTVWGDPLHTNASNTDFIAGGRADLPALPEHLSLGILFCSVAGLLNVLLVLHVMDPKTWREPTRFPLSEHPEDSLQ